MISWGSLDLIAKLSPGVQECQSYLGQRNILSLSPKLIIKDTDIAFGLTYFVLTQRFDDLTCIIPLFWNILLGLRLLKFVTAATPN